MIQGHSHHGASKEQVNPSVDLLIPLMHHDPSDLGSMILKSLRCHALT